MLHSEGQVCDRAHFAQNSLLQGALLFLCGIWSSAFSSVLSKHLKALMRSRFLVLLIVVLNQLIFNADATDQL